MNVSAEYRVCGLITLTMFGTTQSYHRGVLCLLFAGMHSLTVLLEVSQAVAYLTQGLSMLQTIRGAAVKEHARPSAQQETSWTTRGVVFGFAPNAEVRL